MSAAKYDRQIRIERPVADDSFDGAGSGAWALVDDPVWARVLDQRPSRDERLSNGIPMNARRAAVWIRWRDDITADMRFIYNGRILQIIGGPSEIGRRDELEFMTEEYRPAGNPA